MTKLNILVVDDDEGHRYLLGRAISDDMPDANVTFADSSDELLDAMRSNNFECLVMDFNLPGTHDAASLLSEARVALPECKLIVVSSSEDSRVTDVVDQHRGATFIHKDAAMSPNVLSNLIESDCQVNSHADTPSQQP